MSHVAGRRVVGPVGKSFLARCARGLANAAGFQPLRTFSWASGDSRLATYPQTCALRAPVVGFFVVLGFLRTIRFHDFLAMRVKQFS